MNALPKMLNEDQLVTAPLVLNPFLAAYRAWKECYESMAKGMESPGFTAEEAAEVNKDMFETIELEKLLDVERRTYDEP